MRYFLAFIVLIGTKCTNHHIEADNSPKLNVTYQINPMLQSEHPTDSAEHTAIIKTNRNAKESYHRCDCTFSNGLVEIILAEKLGGMLKIMVNDSIFYATYQKRGDIPVDYYNAYPVHQRLTLNTNNFNIGEILYGSIDFEGITFTDLLQDHTSFEININGKFACKLDEKLNSGTYSRWE